MATVLITGGTGLIGKALTNALLAKNYKVIILTRGAVNQHTETGNLSYAQWDIHNQQIEKEAINSADYIIHLAGAGVADKRWTKKRKQEIVNSRVKSSELIVKALKEIPNNIKAVVSSSAIGWYGADPVIPNPKPFREDDRPLGSAQQPHPAVSTIGRLSRPMAGNGTRCGLCPPDRWR